MSDPIKNRYEFCILFDVCNGNPNGDPDNDNRPRMDDETQHGIITNNCLKRKIRDYVAMVREDKPGFGIYIKAGVPLNVSDMTAVEYIGLDNLKDARKKDANAEVKLRDAMCLNFYDIRTFGAVMTSFTKAGLNNGQVRGPVQICDATSVDPITVKEHTISRVAITTEADAARKNNELGRRYTVPYGLYCAKGYISANLAKKVTGFGEEDLKLLWEAILNMFEHDRSAARGEMTVRKLIVFKHENEMGRAPAHRLFESINIRKKPDVEVARAFDDYVVFVDESMIPTGVEAFTLECTGDIEDMSR